MFCSIFDEIRQRWNRLGARNLQGMRTHCAAVCVSLQLALTSKFLARETIPLPFPPLLKIIFPQTFCFVRGSINQLESVFCVDILTTLEGTRKASFITKKMASERWIFNIFKADFPFLCDHARPSRIHNEK